MAGSWETVSLWEAWDTVGMRGMLTASSHGTPRERTPPEQAPVQGQGGGQEQGGGATGAAGAAAGAAGSGLAVGASSGPSAGFAEAVLEFYDAERWVGGQVKPILVVSW